MKLLYKTPRISFWHAQYLFKKMCWQEVRRSLRRSSSADSLDLKISFIFLYVVKNSWTYTKSTICLSGSLYFTECADIEVYLREANHDEYLSLEGFIWNQHNDQHPVGLLAQLFERCTSIAEIMGSNPIQAWILFSGLIFITAQIVFITAKIAFIFTSLSAVQICDFHIFTVVYANRSCTRRKGIQCDISLFCK